MNPVAIAAIAGGALLVYHETKKNNAPVAHEDREHIEDPSAVLGMPYQVS